MPRGDYGECGKKWFTPLLIGQVIRSSDHRFLPVLDLDLAGRADRLLICMIQVIVAGREAYHPQGLL